MMERERLMLAGAAWVLVACGGAAAPAESPPSGVATEEAGAASGATLESGPVTTSGDDAEATSPVIQQELPCPGKNARYWDTGLVRSELLTEDCEINGQSYPAGTRLEFDENGQLIPRE